MITTCGKVETKKAISGAIGGELRLRYRGLFLGALGDELRLRYRGHRGLSEANLAIGAGEEK